MDYFRELADKLFGNAGSMPASGITTITTATANTYPGQMIPVTNLPGQTIGMRIPYMKSGPTLSDFDIELMASCISNKHPVVDGQSHCFCTLKRLERGISKD